MSNSYRQIAASFNVKPSSSSSAAELLKLDGYATPENAAHALAAFLGVKGRSGGWLYDGAGRLICQGWSRYAELLKGAGVLNKAEDGSYRLNPPMLEGDRVKLRRPYIGIDQHARDMGVITEVVQANWLYSVHLDGYDNPHCDFGRTLIAAWAPKLAA